MQSGADPREAFEWFRDEKKQEYTEWTLRSYGYRINPFLEWCEETGVEDTMELDGQSVMRYRQWKFADEDYSVKTVKTQLDSLRVFLRWLEHRDLAKNGLHEAVQSPTVSGSDGQRSETLESDQAKAILSYLSKYHYASDPHVLLSLLWGTGLRIGAARGIDIDDIDEKNLYIQIKHRPDEGTPLKNKTDGERPVAVSERVMEVVQDHIDTNRTDVTDEHGRSPLFASSQGRRSTSNMRETIYQWTQPCRINKECPVGKSPQTCDAAQNLNHASKCPENLYPHAIRRGSITYHLREETPVQIVEERMDVSRDVIEGHYDRRSDLEKMEMRRDYLPD